MTTNIQSIIDHPEFRKLNRTRNLMICGLTAALLGLDLFCFMLMSTLSDFAATPIAKGTNINFGMLFPVLLILSSVGVASFYSWWANTKLDDRRRKFLATLANNQDGASNERL
jgi:uncharacterized membrane protein (DUF485 family)